MTNYAHAPSRVPEARGLASHVSRWLLPIFVAAIVVFTWWPVLLNQFVSLDDQVTIYENDVIVHLTSGGLLNFWMAPYQGLYAPLSYSLIALVAVFSRAHAIGGQKPQFPLYPQAYHGVDLGLHVVATLLVYRILRRFTKARAAAAAGALLFALHPVQVESVAWASETSNLLCACMAFFALTIYFRYLAMPAGPNDRANKRQRFGVYALATEVFLLAMLAKPVAVVLPILAIVLHSLRQRERSTNDDQTHSGGWRKLMPVGLIAWIVLAVPLALIARASQPVPDWWLVVSPRFRPFVAADAITFYLGKIIYPGRLLPDYDRSPASLYASGQWRYTWVVAAIFLASIALLAWRKRAPAYVAGACWFIAAMLPVLGLMVFAFQHSSTVADRYLYLPMFGVSLVFARGLEWVWSAERWHGAKTVVRPAIVLACVAVFILLGLKTRRQIAIWRTTDALFTASEQAIGRKPGAKQNFEPLPASSPEHPEFNRIKWRLEEKKLEG